MTEFVRRWDISRRVAERNLLKNGIQQYIYETPIDYIRHNKTIKNLVARQLSSNDKFDLLKLADELGYEERDILAWLSSEIRGYKSRLTHGAIRRLLNIAGYELKVVIEKKGEDEIDNYDLDPELYDVVGKRVKINKRKYHGRFRNYHGIPRDSV